MLIQLQLDPRVDTDQFGGAGNTASAGGYRAHGMTGAVGSDPTGPHDSRTANKLDPRVDSDRSYSHLMTLGCN